MDTFRILNRTLNYNIGILKHLINLTLNDYIVYNVQFDNCYKTKTTFVIELVHKFSFQEFN